MSVPRAPLLHYPFIPVPKYTISMITYVYMLSNSANIFLAALCVTAVNQGFKSWNKMSIFHMVSFFQSCPQLSISGYRMAQPEGFWDAPFTHTGLSHRVCLRIRVSDRTRSGPAMCCTD